MSKGDTVVRELRVATRCANNPVILIKRQVVVVATLVNASSWLLTKRGIITLALES